MKNTGKIIRSDKKGKSNYTAISNNILQSKVLSCEQKSILVHLLSLPNDWSIYKGTIWKIMNIGRERFKKAWKGLVKTGYIVENKIIEKNNLIRGYHYIVYEDPQLSEQPESGQTGIQTDRNVVGIQKNNTQKKKEQKKNIEKNDTGNNTSISTSNEIDSKITDDLESIQNRFIELSSQRYNLLERIQLSCQTGKYLVKEITINNIRNIQQINNYQQAFRSIEIEMLQNLINEYWTLNSQFEKCSEILTQKSNANDSISTET